MPSQESRSPRPTPAVYRRRRVGAVVVAAGALTAAALGADHLRSSQKGGGMPNEITYTVQPGDTAWGIARQIETNQDGVAGNQDVRPMVDDIMGQARLDGENGLQPGERIQVPQAADTDPQTPDAQLSGK